jgi:hypothetical protein
MKIIIKNIIIGVKSKGHIFAGIFFLIKEYIGSIISDINFGLTFNQKITSHDNIISIITIHCIISRKMSIQKIIISIIIFYC